VRRLQLLLLAVAVVGCNLIGGAATPTTFPAICNLTPCAAGVANCSQALGSDALCIQRDWADFCASPPNAGGSEIGVLSSFAAPPNDVYALLHIRDKYRVPLSQLTMYAAERTRGKFLCVIFVLTFFVCEKL
jgi:hypothetical protein